MVQSLESLERTVATYKAREIGMLKRENEAKEHANAAVVAAEQADVRAETLRAEVNRNKETMRLAQDSLRVELTADKDFMCKRLKEQADSLQKEVATLEQACQSLEGDKDKASRAQRSCEERLVRLQHSSRQEHERLQRQAQEAREELVEVRGETAGLVDRAARGLSDVDLRRTELDSGNALLLKASRDAASREEAATRETGLHKQQLLTLAVELREARARHGSEQEEMQQRLVSLEEAARGQADQASTLRSRLEQAARLQRDTERRGDELAAAQEDLALRWREESRTNIEYASKLEVEREANHERVRRAVAAEERAQRDGEMAGKAAEAAKHELSAMLDKLAHAMSRLATHDKLVEQHRDLKQKAERSELARRRLERQAAANIAQARQNPEECAPGDTDENSYMQSLVA
jgi:hypothetical protein